MMRSLALLLATGRSASAAFLERQHGTALSVGIDLSYSYYECRQTPEVSDADVLNDPLGMTVAKCFAFCTKTKGSPQQYFGITGKVAQPGGSCWCAPLLPDKGADAPVCDNTCPGNNQQTCGGINGAASVFVTFDCGEKTTEEVAKAAEEDRQKMLADYSTFEGETCGQHADNKVNGANGANTLVGSVDDCKAACTASPEGAKCHGFTYETGPSRCTFHADVLDGDMVKTEGNTCYFKKI